MDVQLWICNKGDAIMDKSGFPLKLYVRSNFHFTVFGKFSVHHKFYVEVTKIE